MKTKAKTRNKKSDIRHVRISPAGKVEGVLGRGGIRGGYCGGASEVHDDVRQGKDLSRKKRSAFQVSVHAAQVLWGKRGGEVQPRVNLAMGLQHVEIDGHEQLLFHPDEPAAAVAAADNTQLF